MALIHQHKCHRLMAATIPLQVWTTFRCAGALDVGALFQRLHRGIDAAGAVRHAGGGQGPSPRRTARPSRSARCTRRDGRCGTPCPRACSGRSRATCCNCRARPCGTCRRRAPAASAPRSAPANIPRAPGTALRGPNASTAARVAAARRLWRANTVIQPLLQQHRDGFAQAVKQVGGRRVGEEAVGVGLEHLFPIPIGARHLVGLGRRPGPFRRSR